MSDKKYIIPYKLFVGCFLPNWLCERTEVSLGAKVVYARLCQFADKSTGVAWPKQKSIADSVGICERGVHKFIHELEKIGLIEIERVGLGSPNKYRFLEHQYFAALEPQGCAEQEPQGCAAPSILKESSEKTIGDSKKKTVISPIVEAIYQAYPRKVAKPNGLAAIAKAIDRVSRRTIPLSPERLLELTRRYASSVSSKDMGFIPHPATWFNGDRFDDEPDTPPPSSPFLASRIEQPKSATWN